MRSTSFLAGVYVVLSLFDGLVARPVPQTSPQDQAQTLLPAEGIAGAPHPLSKRSPVFDLAKRDSVLSLKALALRVVMPDERATALRKNFLEDWGFVSELEETHTGTQNPPGTRLLVGADGKPLAYPDGRLWTRPDEDLVPPKSPMMEKEISDWLANEKSPRVFWMLQSLMYPEDDRYPMITDRLYAKTPYYLQTAWRNLMRKFNTAEQSAVITAVCGWNLTPEQLHSLLQAEEAIPMAVTTVKPEQRAKAVLKLSERTLQEIFGNLAERPFPMTLKQAGMLNELVVDLTKPPRTFQEEDRVTTYYNHDEAHNNFPGLKAGRNIGQDFERLKWDEQVSLWVLAKYATKKWDDFKTTLGPHLI